MGGFRDGGGEDDGDGDAGGEDGRREDGGDAGSSGALAAPVVVRLVRSLVQLVAPKVASQTAAWAERMSW
jgi:hypothetical protein